MKLPKNFEDIDGMGDRSQSAIPWHPIGGARTSAGKQSSIPWRPIPSIYHRSQSSRPWHPWSPSRAKVIKRGARTSAAPGPYVNPDGIMRASAGPYGPWKPVPEFGQFDGGAVKKNWIPLVVLGMSLAVGIGISEWASKKYIK